MRLLVFFIGLAVATAFFSSCTRNPEAQKIVRVSIPKAKIQRAKEKAMARKFSKGLTASNTPGDRLIFCAAAAVTAADITDPDNNCVFSGVTDPETGQPGSNVDVNPGQITFFADGTGFVDSNGFTQDDGDSEDEEVFVAEFAVTPGLQRQFNFMVFDINSTETGFTDCLTMVSEGAKIRLDTDANNGGGSMDFGANISTIVADVNEGVTEIIIEDENSNDTQLVRCCGPLFAETCAEAVTP